MGRRGANAILASGAPAASTNPDRWTGPFGLDQRFGTAGAATFLFDWARERGRIEYSDRAFQMVDDIISRATVGPEGRHWSLALYPFQDGDGSAVFTGYFYGASGLGLSLLRAHYSRTSQYPAIRLPDDPFPRR